MLIRGINDPHARKVAGVLEALLQEAEVGELISLAFVAERRSRKSIDGVTGRFRSDPLRVLGAITVMKSKLARVAAKKDETPEDPL